MDLKLSLLFLTFLVQNGYCLVWPDCYEEFSVGQMLTGVAMIDYSAMSVEACTTGCPFSGAKGAQVRTICS